jgi:hypothetical protein
MKMRWRTVALGLGLGWAVTVLIAWTIAQGTPVDAWCYYGFDAAEPWDPAHCFLYTPPVAQAMLVVREILPFEAFVVVLRVTEVIVLALLAGPAIGLALFIPAVAIEINAANVNLLLVGAVLLGFRYPWTWAFVILTKVTPGIGLLWFAARREWRHFAIALGATVAIAAVSFVAAPWMWSAWASGLMGEPDASPFLLWWRLPLAAAIVIWGARTDRKWALIVAVAIAMPRWYYLTPVILVGLFAVVRLPRPLPFLGWRPVTRVVQPAAATTSVGRVTRAPSS